MSQLIGYVSHSYATHMARPGNNNIVILEKISDCSRVTVWSPDNYWTGLDMVMLNTHPSASRKEIIKLHLVRFLEITRLDQKSCYLWPQRLTGYNCRDVKLAWQILERYFSRKCEYKAIKVREGVMGVAK